MHFLKHKTFPEIVNKFWEWEHICETDYFFKIVIKFWKGEYFLTIMNNCFKWEYFSKLQNKIFKLEHILKLFNKNCKHGFFNLWIILLNGTYFETPGKMKIWTFFGNCGHFFNMCQNLKINVPNIFYEKRIFSEMHKQFFEKCKHFHNLRKKLKHEHFFIFEIFLKHEQILNFPNNFQKKQKTEKGNRKKEKKEEEGTERQKKEMKLKNKKEAKFLMLTMMPSITTQSRHLVGRPCLHLVQLG